MDIVVFKRTYLQCVIEHIQTPVLVTEEMVVTLPYSSSRKSFL